MELARIYFKNKNIYIIEIRLPYRIKHINLSRFIDQYMNIAPLNSKQKHKKLIELKIYLIKIAMIWTNNQQ